MIQCMDVSSIQLRQIISTQTTKPGAGAGAGDARVRLLQLIANDAYRMGHFAVAIKVRAGRVGSFPSVGILCMCSVSTGSILIVKVRLAWPLS